jgi:ABC-type xylose transport system permease subunit
LDDGLIDDYSRTKGSASMNVQYSRARIEGLNRTGASQLTVRTQSPRCKVASTKRLFPVALLAVLCVVFTALNPRFLELQNLITILQQTVTLLVAALGMALVIIARFDRSFGRLGS